ncbi:hypothetical protein B566_EDAN011123 [Ephemera danica]|nr:hypothetical protein B566_EDAN011123 [Ephemera danica]
MESLTLLYNVAYNWIEKGFSYKAAYHFMQDRGCGKNMYTEIEGTIEFKPQTGGNANAGKNRFYFHRCLWLLHSNVERQLTVEISTTHTPATCASWNITILKPSKSGQGPTQNPLYIFCPSERRRSYTLPWKIHSVYIRLQSLSQVQPVFNIRWKSIIVNANNRVSGPNDAAVHSSSARHSLFWLALPVLLGACLSNT